MKRLIIIVITLTLLASCATKRHCDAYGNKSGQEWNKNVIYA